MSKKKSKKKEDIMDLQMVIWMPPPEKHPSLDQEDPINDKRPKSIEVSPWGIEWTRN
jgi:hypothetical protein